MVAIVAPAVRLELSDSQTFSVPIEICFEFTLPDGTVQIIFYNFSLADSW